MSDNCDRIIDLIDLPEWGRVVPLADVEPFCVVDEAARSATTDLGIPAIATHHGR